MQAFCDKIYNWCFEISSFAPGDNGAAVKPIKPEHQYFAAVSPPPNTPNHKYVQVKNVGAIKTDDDNNLFPLSFEEFLATQEK